MNKYIKFCPNVFVMATEQSFRKGDTATITTKYGQEHEVEVWNFLGKNREGLNLYSITRCDGFNAQERAKRRAERLHGYANNAQKRAETYHEASNEGREFLKLAEPIKIGHHSEKRHRALIERNHKRMNNAMREYDRAEAYEARTAYWEAKAQEINLSMPESIEYYEYKLEAAKMQHEGLKDGSIPKKHSYSLTYAKKAVNEAQKNLETAKTLWS
jgi:hypothetical protein